MSNREEFLRLATRCNVIELMRICYAADAPVTPERLGRYLEALRANGSNRAVFASVIICYDLARRGDAQKQQEFECLAYLLYSSPERTLYLDELLSDVPEIAMIWRDCEHYLESIDSRFGPEPEPVNIDAIAEPVIAPPTRRAEDPPEVQAKFREIMTYFFQDNPNYPTPMPQAGFRLNGPSDVQRFELCLGDLEPLARVSERAHAFKTWMELFFGLHMRSRGLFGTINQKKVRTLQSGLRGYLESGPEFFELSQYFSTDYIQPDAWEKMGEFLYDFSGWLSRHPLNTGIEIVSSYPVIDRLDAIYQKRGDERRRGRRDRY